jgi:hypothetical protein
MSNIGITRYHEPAGATFQPSGSNHHELVQHQPKMNVHKTSSRKKVVKGRPDYYITPTRNFTQYTRDSEEKYWNKETKFDWHQSIVENLKEHLDNLDPKDFSRIMFMALPMIKEALERKLSHIRQARLPIDEDALKDIAECIPFNSAAIHQALDMLSPLKGLELAASTLKDRLEILNSEYLDMYEQRRLGFFKVGTSVKRLETDAERQQQSLQLSQLSEQIQQARKEWAQLKARNTLESERLKAKIGSELVAIEPRIWVELEESRELLRRTLESGQPPSDPGDLSRLKDLMIKRQLRGLKDIANHALVVEQSAIAPLTMGIIHYKRHREIQEAMTTFIGDEAKHSATFRRYLVEKLEAKEFISDILIKGAGRYMWLARFMPGAGLFMAVIVEAIGAAYLEFFANKEYMPERLFCSICTTISTQDEARHMDLCAEMYNELFRSGGQWERIRNAAALKVLLKSVYGDKDEDHHLIQAFRAFGVESEVLYKYITDRLSVQLARVSVYIEPERLLEMIGITPK